MEIVGSTATENSKKQMNETLTTEASAEYSNKNITTICRSSSANNSAAASSTAETRTKDNKITTKIQNLTAMDSGASDTTNKDMDIEIIEIPSHNISKAEYAKAKIEPGAKLLASNVAGGLATHLDDDIPIISISDGEDSGGPPAASAEKVKRKRSSVGAATAEDDAHFLLKRRKIKVAGAPKMPLTGYVRYMNERRETLRKELPSKTAIEHTKIIGEEWQKMSDDKKAPYIKAAETDKQRYLDELHTFLKERPDVLACELAKNKQMRKSPGEVGKVVLKEKSQSMGNITSPSKELNVSGAGMSKDKDNSPLPPTAQSATATTAKTASGLESKNRRKRTPTPTNVGRGNNSNSNNNSNNTSNNSSDNNHNSNTNNKSNHNNNSNTTTIPSVATTNTSVPTATITIQSANTAASLLAATAVPGEIPIFTNEFLEHNKIFDMELRTLRKSKTDLEQQNAVLEKHVENMKFGVEKMTNENDELAEKNRLLELYLEKLKSKLAHALSGLAIPSQPNGATMDNIEKYMCDLYKMATTNTHGPASLNKAKDIIRKLDLQINL